MEKLDQYVSKRLFYIAFSLFMAVSIIVSMVFAKPDLMAYQARMRVSRSASITLSTTYQTVLWSGTSAGGFNVNTFAPDPAGSGNQLVMSNATTGLYTFYNTTDVNYELFFTCATTSTLLTTPVNLRMRIVIPNGGGAGVDIHFPNPDNDGYVDLGPCTYVNPTNYSMTIPIYISQVIRTNGFYIQLALSNGTLGTVTFVNGSCLIQSTGATN